MRPLYLLDLPVIAELTRRAGNRRVFTLFAQRQSLCALAAPVVSALLKGVESLPAGERRARLGQFTTQLLNSGLPVLAFDREAAIWLARESARRARSWTTVEGQLAAIAAVNELTLVTRSGAFSATPGLKTEDWFRP